jgi:hypothetical protein
MVAIHVYKWMESIGHWSSGKKIEKLSKYFEETPFCSFGGSWL